MKMVAYRPNVVVVEKSVSRLAQEYLLEISPLAKSLLPLAILNFPGKTLS